MKYNTEGIEIDTDAWKQKDYNQQAYTDSFGVDILTADSQLQMYKINRIKEDENNNLKSSILFSNYNYNSDITQEVFAVSSQTEIFTYRPRYGAYPDVVNRQDNYGIILILVCSAIIGIILAKMVYRKGNEDVHNDNATNK